MRFMALLFVAGCLISPDRNEPLTNVERAWIDDALPVFQASCMSCHATPAHGFAFLAGTSDLDIRLTLLTSGYVDLSDPPTASPLLVKGVHSGPSLTTEQSAAIIRWLDAEGAP